MTAPAFQTAERKARGARPMLPTFSAVLQAQVRAMGLTLRRTALIGVGLLAMVTLVIVLQGVSMGSIVSLYEWPTMLPGVMGALLPIAVWARDERYGPGFLWTLPVDRRRHALAKILAGWMWLMVAVALYALWLLALTLMSGGQVVPPYTLQVLTSPVPLTEALDPATLRAVRWAPSLLIWAVPFTAATACYLLGNAVVLGPRHPLRWVIGTVLTYGMLAVAGDAASVKFGVGGLADVPGGFMQAIVEGRYGVDALLTARTGGSNTTVFLTTGERALVWRSVPDLADWRMATLLWTVFGLVTLWAAISRHGEERRS